MMCYLLSLVAAASSASVVFYMYLLRRKERERRRLETIVIQQQTQMKRIENANDRLHADYTERGKLTAKLNRELQDALKRLRRMEAANE